MCLVSLNNCVNTYKLVVNWLILLVIIVKVSRISKTSATPKSRTDDMLVYSINWLVRLLIFWYFYLILRVGEITSANLLFKRIEFPGMNNLIPTCRQRNFQKSLIKHFNTRAADDIGMISQTNELWNYTDNIIAHSFSMDWILLYDQFLLFRSIPNL